MDPITTSSSRTQARSIKPRTHAADAATATALPTKLSGLPTDVLRHVLAQGDVAANVGLLQQLVLENRTPDGPWSSARHAIP